MWNQSSQRLKPNLTAERKSNITIKTPEPEINIQKPLADDLLNRTELVKQLTSLVKDQHEPLRISINGAWGTGKTFLLERWAQELQNQGFRAIYFNAWEDDFQQDPLVAILGQISLDLQKDRTFQENLKSLGIITKKLLKATGYETIKAATRIDGGRIAQTFQEDNPLAKYRKKRELTDNLKQSLEKLASTVQTKTGNPLIFIIDELDRCQPTFAVKCLERVKHLMETPNMTFVFGINKNQICQAIRHVNGEIDASTYLQKFFDFELNLQEPDMATFCLKELGRTGTLKYLREKSKESQHPDVPGYTQEEKLIRFMPAMCKAMGLSLREAQQWVRTIALAARTRDTNEMRDIRFLEILPLLKIKNPDLYLRLRNGKAKTLEVTEWIEKGMTNWTPETVKVEETIIKEELRAIAILIILINRLVDKDTSNQLTTLGEKKGEGKTDLLPPILQEDPEETAKIHEQMTRDLFHQTEGSEAIINRIFRYIDLDNLQLGGITTLTFGTGSPNHAIEETIQETET